MLDLSKLTSKIRGITNQRVESSEQAFFTDEEIKDYMQDSWSNLYYMMVEARKNWFNKETNFTVADGDRGKKKLPLDFYRMAKLEYIYGQANSGVEDNTLEIDEISVGEDQQYQQKIAYDSYWGPRRIDDTYPERAFILHPDHVELFPKISSSGNYKMLYIPECLPIDSELINPPEGSPLLASKYFKLPRGFENWIKWETSVMIGIPEEGDLDNIRKELVVAKRKVTQWCSDRTNKKAKSIKRTVDYHGRRLDSSTSRFWPHGR